MSGEEEEECGIAIGGSSSASCCEPMRRAKKSVRSLLREKPWLRRRSFERERERERERELSFVWQPLVIYSGI